MSLSPGTPVQVQQLNTLLSALSAAWQPPAFTPQLKGRRFSFLSSLLEKTKIKIGEIAELNLAVLGLEIRAAVKRLDGGDAEVHSGRGRPPP